MAVEFGGGARRVVGVSTFVSTRFFFLSLLWALYHWSQLVVEVNLAEVASTQFETHSD
jgi:hypothetical protein